jgi:hypothetical protein
MIFLFYENGPPGRNASARQNLPGRAKTFRFKLLRVFLAGREPSP